MGVHPGGSTSRHRARLGEVSLTGEEAHARERRTLGRWQGVTTVTADGTDADEYDMSIHADAEEPDDATRRIRLTDAPPMAGRHVAGPLALPLTRRMPSSKGPTVGVVPGAARSRAEQPSRPSSAGDPEQPYGADRLIGAGSPIPRIASRPLKPSTAGRWWWRWPRWPGPQLQEGRTVGPHRDKSTARKPGGRHRSV